jgi:putrescine transport system substrate-binding protein
LPPDMNAMSEQGLARAEDKGKAWHLVWLVAIVALSGCSDGTGVAAAGTEEPVLNVYNWSDYIADDTVPEFTRRTGIEIQYDVFDSNEVLETKLLAANTGYDLVVPTASFMERQIIAGVFRPLDKSLLPNYKNLDPEILALAARHDPGNAHSIPYVWGTVGVGYNVDMIAQRLPDAPVGSARMVLDPEIVSHFADCGVAILDAPTDISNVVLSFIGKDPNGHNVDELAAMEATLAKVRPYIRYFHSSQYINDLANGQICIALGWSGDIFQARDRAREANNGVNVAYTIPEEGSIIWFDMFAIPVDAPHPENAHRFLDYLMEPEVIAAVTNQLGYPSANAASLPYVKESIRNDPGVYPPPEVLKRLSPDLAEPPAYTRKLNRSWTRIKTGR